MYLVVAVIFAGLAASLGAPNPPAPQQGAISGSVNTPVNIFVNTLMPQPSQLSAQGGQLRLTPSFGVATDRYHDARLNAAIAHGLARIKMQTGILFSTSPSSAAASAALVISVDGPGETIQSVDEDESYSLDVAPSGVRLHAATVVGAMRGLETLQQLLQTDATGYFLPAVSIHDSARFRWRGLMIDCGRHFMPVDVLLRTLDGMAAVKLNVFHWHLSEDQGFRIESRAFPKLTELG